MRVPVSAVLLIALLATAAQAASLSPPASDPCQGPDTNIDLESNMPPIYDQGQSQWCSAFSAKTLLDYNAHVDCQKQSDSSPSSCAYTPATMVSATDLISDSSAADPKLRGKYLDLGSDGGVISGVLEGAQKSGTLSDSELPIDQALFVGNTATGGPDEALITRLSEYYSQLPSALANSSGCSETQDPFQDLEARYPLLQQIATQAIADQGGKNDKAQDEMLKALEEKYYPIPDSVQAERHPVEPPYNIVDFLTSDPNGYKSHIVDTLKLNQPLVLSVCINQLIQKAHIPSQPTDPNDPCGAHGMAVVGFRKTSSGACEVHLRNSWGNQWPQDPSGSGKHGDGTVWVDMNTFVQSEGDRSTAAGNLEAVSIQPRHDGSPIRNQILQDNEHLIGQTWKSLPVGKIQRVSLDEKGQIVTETGVFGPTGALAHGERSSADGNRVWGRFNATSPLPVCGAVTSTTHQIYCFSNGKVHTPAVSSPDRCPCVK